MTRKAIKYLLLVVFIALAVMQFFPPDRANPPSDPAASFAAVAHPPRQVAALVERACRDCHSNGTVWPWYSRLFPASYLIIDDIKVARAKLNFSEWNRLGPEMARLRLTQACEQLQAGKMPLWYYRPFHPEAKVSPEEVNALCAFAAASAASNAPPAR